MIDKNKIKNLLDEIKDEDELPSQAGQAGQAFRDVINQQFAGNLGDRELQIISNWLVLYTDMTWDEKKEVVDKLNELEGV